MMKINNMDIA